MYREYQKYKAVAGLSLTTKDIEGPFYKPKAPYTVDGKIVSDPNMSLSGVVTTADGNPIPSAVLDFWQANERGEYDNIGFFLRRKIRVGEDGKYKIETIKPGCYAIDEKEFRCPHIHVKIWIGNHCVLTTQLYFEKGEHNETDHWFDESRLIRDDKFNFVVEIS